MPAYRTNFILHQIGVGLDLFTSETKRVPGNREVRETPFKTLMNNSVSRNENA
jgi:hypothetical protein